MENQYQYRVLVGGGVDSRWFDTIEEASRPLKASRLRNFMNHVVLEISPWFRRPDGKWECPGCEYASCPVGSK